MIFIPSGSQTVGPYFSIGLRHLNQDPGIARAKWPLGTTISGVVSDGDGKPIPDSMLEFFSDGFFARASTTETGEYQVIVPPELSRCEVLVFMRGLLKPALTRLYLSKEAAANDTAISHVPQERQATLFARPAGERRFEWNIKMQGEDETAFFDA